MVEHIQTLAFWTPGPIELVVILLVALLLFGRKLPEIARNVGKSLTEFKKGVNEAKETREELMKDVNQVKDDVIRDAREASGFDELNRD
jgi:sec-independent protein translocase protein TatA